MVPIYLRVADRRRTLVLPHLLEIPRGRRVQQCDVERDGRNPGRCRSAAGTEAVRKEALNSSKKISQKKHKRHKKGTPRLFYSFLLVPFVLFVANLLS